MNASNTDDSKPRRSPPPSSLSDPAPVASAVRYHVLIIDDDPVVLHVLRRVPETRHEVTTAASFVELTALFERSSTSTRSYATSGC